MSAAAFADFQDRFSISGKISSTTTYYKKLANDIIDVYNTAYA
jgi:hypothetical protein